jgi:benzoate membrane transport protein
MNPFEKPTQALPGLGETLRLFDRHNLVNGFVAMLFAATGPLVILLSIASEGGLSEEATASWIFGAYTFGGVFSLLASWFYRQTLSIMWTIPGAVLVGTALDHLSLPEIVGAYLVCGVIMLVMGLSGAVARVMALIPLPIVMGMVAAVFLRFCLAMIDAFQNATLMALAMAAAFLIASRFAAIGRVLPPILAALVAGAVLLPWTPGGGELGGLAFSFAEPVLYRPVFSWPAIAELTLPLLVTVVGIQNAQGFAILRQAGFSPPQNVLTMICGVGTLVFGMFGAVPTCVTGPANAILNNSGRLQDRFAGGIVFGLIAIAFGVSAPFMTRLGLSLPIAYIGMLGGLAMLPILQGAFVTAFKDRFTLGALVAFVVTVSDVAIFNIGAPFWGLIFGCLISLLLEAKDFRSLREGAADQA